MFIFLKECVKNYEIFFGLPLLFFGIYCFVYLDFCSVLFIFKWLFAIRIFVDFFQTEFAVVKARNTLLPDWESKNCCYFFYKLFLHTGFRGYLFFTKLVIINLNSAFGAVHKLCHAPWLGRGLLGL